MLCRPSCGDLTSMRSSSLGQRSCVKAWTTWQTTHGLAMRKIMHSVDRLCCSTNIGRLTPLNGLCSCSRGLSSTTVESSAIASSIRISSNHSHCADSLSVNSNLNPRTILSCDQVVQQSLDASAGADKEMTLARAQKEVLRLLQVADNFFSASGGNKTSSAGTSRTRSMTLYMGLFLVSSSELLCLHTPVDLSRKLLGTTSCLSRKQRWYSNTVIYFVIPLLKRLPLRISRIKRRSDLLRLFVTGQESTGFNARRFSAKVDTCLEKASNYVVANKLSERTKQPGVGLCAACVA